MKAKATGSRSATKATRPAKTVDEYLARIPEPGRATLQKIRAAIRAAVPAEATEVISYGMPAFKHNGVLIWFAGFAKHCSLFPTGAVIEMFKKELRGCTISKGTIQFPLDKPLPAALLRKMVKERIRQMASKNKKRTWVLAQ